MPPLFRGNPAFFGIMAGIVAIQVLLVQYGGDFSTVPPVLGNGFSYFS